MRVLGILLMLVIGAFASSPQGLQTAKVVAVTKYDRGRIVNWTGRTPIYDDRPLYDITIKVADKPYIVRYEPGKDYYPDVWKVGQDIQIKKQRGRFLLMNGDRAVPANIVSKNNCVPNPGYGMAVPVLPCP
jgi:hypothetical protein